ncbi:MULTISPECIES: DUF2071 domain-containing protein [Mycobacterium]|uniref:DUF2071 domain-containing protein n=1 Tax=Mycobacterium colombiense TaxID=339268 RepID=A0A329M9M5_9MYCO|nr:MULTISPECIES: DUF2071 domain-containing protein [Mycobacterium]MDM4139403.1 DUF2071 domain-containing protein [Mycobacterium sp. FLAC0960]RAV16614.1 hypothetical protein DQP57_02920 [Mycobacterium colombiense]
MTATPGPPAAQPNEPPGLEGFPRTPPPLAGPVTFDQHWRDVTFIHWPVRPESVETMYPPGTRPDVFADGMTYVGLIPFAMRSTKVVGALPLPYFGSFLETNVRLYSIDDAGHHGVLFLSLETARLAVVPVTRLGLGVPYTWARMRLRRHDGRIGYDSVRRWPRSGVYSRIEIAVGDAVEPTPLEIWLTARWGAHTRTAGRTWWVPNEHGPWPFRAAEVVGLDSELVEASGVRPVGDRLRALYSCGVRTRFGRRQLVR